MEFNWQWLRSHYVPLAGLYLNIKKLTSSHCIDFPFRPGKYLAFGGYNGGILAPPSGVF